MEDNQKEPKEQKRKIIIESPGFKLSLFTHTTSQHDTLNSSIYTEKTSQAD